MSIFNEFSDIAYGSAKALYNRNRNLAFTVNRSIGQNIDMKLSSLGSRALTKVSHMSDLGMASAGGAIGGAIGGGVYGAFSDDRSVLGGMAMGAMGGLGFGLGYYGSRVGINHYKALRGRGFDMFSSAQYSLKEIGRRSKAFIGNSITNNKTYGKIKGLASI